MIIVTHVPKMKEWLSENKSLPMPDEMVSAYQTLYKKIIWTILKKNSSCGSLQG